MKLVIKLFDFIQHQYDISENLRRAALVGISEDVCRDLLEYVMEDEAHRIYDKQGRIVPIIFPVDMENDIQQTKDGLWSIPSVTLPVNSYKEATELYKRECQIDYEKRGWGRGDRRIFCTDVRNRASQEDRPVLFLATDIKDLNTSIVSAVTPFGFQTDAHEGDGCGYFLQDDFFLKLLPKIKHEKEKQWPSDYVACLKTVFDEFSGPNDAWNILSALNNAADDDDTISLQRFESIIGLPNSCSNRLQIQTLREQSSMIKTIADLLASGQRDILFERLNETLSENTELVESFRNYVLERSAITAIEDSPHELFAGRARNRSIFSVEPWWEKITLEVLDKALPGQISNLKVSVSDALLGDFSDRKQPIIAKNSLTFSFSIDENDPKITATRAKTQIADDITVVDGFVYQASVADSRVFKLTFTASVDSSKPSKASHDIIMLDELAAGCFVTIGDSVVLKKAYPFAPSRKNAEHSFASRIVACKETNSEMRIYVGAHFKLSTDSVTAKAEGSPTAEILHVTSYDRYYGFRGDLHDGMEFAFEGKVNGKKTKFTVKIEVDHKDEASCESVFRYLVDYHLGCVGKNASVCFDSSPISSRLSQAHLTAIAESDSLIGYPLVIAADIAAKTGNVWLESRKPATSKVFQTYDTRLPYEAWKNAATSEVAQAYFKARKELYSMFRDASKSNGIFGGDVVEEYNLYEMTMSGNENLKSLLVNFLQSYNDWLEADFTNAIIVDTIWAYLGSSESLGTHPDAIFLPPEHPIRLYWQFQAQKMMYNLLTHSHRSGVVSSFDPHSVPDVIYMPIYDGTVGKISSVGYFSVPTSSDYWGAYHSYISDMAIEESEFFTSWGFSITSLKRTMNAGEVESAISATQAVCIAKDALNIRFIAKNLGGKASKLLLRKGVEFLNGRGEEGPELGPRQISIIGPRASNILEGVTDAEIMKAREITDGRLQWFVESPTAKNRLRVDVTIASLGAAGISPYRVDSNPSYGVVAAGGLLRYRNRGRGAAAANEIVESRQVTVATDLENTSEDDIFLHTLQLIEGVDHLNASESDKGHIRFAADIVGAGIMSPNDNSSHYYAISSADVDQACFIALNGDSKVYLWEYRLPMPGAHSSGTDGFYLLAKENPTMIQAVCEALKALNPKGISDEKIREMLFLSAKRGIPTVKNLASGGKNALGEVGVLVTLNLLQGNMLENPRVGLMPALMEHDNNVFINILVPMDIFRERYEALLGSAQHMQRPDIVSFSIKCRKCESTYEPIALCISPIEVKTRLENLTATQKEDALEQCKPFMQLFDSEPATQIARWERNDFIISMMTFGFRVYQSIPELISILISIYPKVIKRIFEFKNFVRINKNPRLSVIHNIPDSKLSSVSEGIPCILEMSHEDGFMIATTGHIPDAFSNVGPWGLLPNHECADVPTSKIQKETLPETSKPSPEIMKIPPVALPATNPSDDSVGKNNVPEEPLSSDAVQTQSTEEKYAELLSRIRDAFEDNGIKTERISPPVETPNFILIDYKGTPTCTVSKISSRKEVFMTTYSVNLHRVEPRMGCVRLVLQRDERAMLYMDEVWSKFHYDEDAAKNKGLLVAIQEDTDEAIYLNPLGGLSAPHTLVAGETGSGKSVLMNNMLYCLKDRFPQDQVKVIIMDPKQVEFMEFADVQNFKVITDKETAIAEFQALVAEMKKRYAIFKDFKCKKISQLSEKNGAPKLPIIWCFHDEFAEWFRDSSYKDSVSNDVNSLGAMARAAGIFLVFATQRPEASIMPPELRSNLGNRLILKVADPGTSAIALGDAKAFGAANELLGNGHMIIISGAKKAYCQVPNIKD